MFIISFLPTKKGQSVGLLKFNPSMTLAKDSIAVFVLQMEIKGFGDVYSLQWAIRGRKRFIEGKKVVIQGDLLIFD